SGTNDFFLNIAIGIRVKQCNFEVIFIQSFSIRQSHTYSGTGIIPVLINFNGIGKVLMKESTLLSVSIAPHIHAELRWEVTSTWRTIVTENTELNGFIGLNIEEQVSVLIYKSVIKTQDLY